MIRARVHKSRVFDRWAREVGVAECAGGIGVIVRGRFF